MHFLLNDAVLSLNGDQLSPAAIERRFRSVGFDYVQSLAQELYSEEPLLQRTHPERAQKLAALIRAKQPLINAALFVSPGKGCKADQVGVRFASIDITVIATLQMAQQNGDLTAVFADREVWRRLAA